MTPTKRDKQIFLDAYARYQDSCTGTLEAQTNLRRTVLEANALLKNVKIARAAGLDNFDPADTAKAAEAFLMQAEAYGDMATALTEQAGALEAATEIAVDLIGKAQEEAAGLQ